jgi:hypothetical protein
MFESIFDYYADKFINKSKLVINNHKHQIMEIEFYLTCTDHPDPFTHQSEDQSIPDKWYFHKKGGTYKQGTYKGLDITFRPSHLSPDDTCYGGILIRSIYDIDNNKFIEGPCNVVDHILNICNYTSINNFVTNNATLNVNDTLSQLYILPCSRNIVPLYNSPRVGLTLKQFNNLRAIYIMKNYRYMIQPHLFKKNRNLITMQLYEENTDISTISNCMNMPESRINGYINIYKSGIEENPEKYGGNNLKADDLIKLMASCRKHI